MSSSVVEGILCSRQHLNPPWIGYCWRCGAAIAPDQAPSERGPHLTLGALVDEQGGITPVIDEVLLADGPAEDRGALSNAVRIRADGWRIVLHKLSGAHVAVHLTDADGWRWLEDGEELELLAGSEIRLGRRRLSFDSHLWRRREPAALR